MGIFKKEDYLTRQALRSPSQSEGFTLLELLGVIAVIVILVGILLPAAIRSAARIDRDRAKTQIAALETALSMYYDDWGCYPPSVSGDGSQQDFVQLDPADPQYYSGQNGQHNGNGPFTKYEWWEHDPRYGSDTAPVTLDSPGCNLVVALTSTLRNGPYIKFRNEELQCWHPFNKYQDEDEKWQTDYYPIDTANTMALLDPWGKAYVYTCNNRGADYDPQDGENWDPDAGRGKLGPFHNTKSYDLYSFGQDGKTKGCKDPSTQDAFNSSGDGNDDDDINNWSTR